MSFFPRKKSIVLFSALILFSGLLFVKSASVANAQVWANTGNLAGATAVISLFESGGTLYAGTSPSGDVFKSTDGGTTWANTGNLADIGVDATAVYSIIESGGTLYAGTSPYGNVFKSNNRGITWTNTGNLTDGTHGDLGVVYSLLESGGAIYAATGTPVGFVFKSTDGGTTWNHFGKLIDPLLNYAVLVRALAKFGTILYAGTGPSADGFDVFNSTDGGVTWNCTNGLSGSIQTESLFVKPDGTIYAGTQINGDVFKSTDGGTTWANTGNLIDGANQATAVFSLFESGGTLYAGTSPYGDVFKLIPPPACTLSASPASIASGDSSTLNWTTTDTTSASIDQGIGNVTPVIAGNKTVTPATTTTYIMTVAGSGTTTCQTTINVSPPPPPPTGGLVPCGRLADNLATGDIDESKPCTLCALFYMLKNIINLVMTLAIGVGVFILIIAGLLYAFSAGDSGKIQLAKSAITSAIIGIAIIFIAWMAIAIILQGMGYANMSVWSQVNCVLPT